MQVDEARLLFDYDAWANTLLLEAALRLPPDEFGRNLGSSFASIKGTLVHILDGSWTWLMWWQGKPRRPGLKPEDFADAAAVAGAFPALAAGQRAWLDGLTDDALRARVAVKDRRYILAHLITHMITHSMYHRGQVASLIRQLGHAPPNTGFRTGFLDASGLFESSS